MSGSKEISIALRLAESGRQWGGEGNREEVRLARGRLDEVDGVEGARERRLAQGRIGPGWWIY